jgi:hypothetical protein
MKAIDINKLTFWQEFLQDDIPISLSPEEYRTAFGDFNSEDYQLLNGSWHRKSEVMTEIEIMNKFGPDWVHVLMRQYESEERYEDCAKLKAVIDKWEIHY